ncbi:MAG: proprotein convertase P-domain-containing protein [Oligoflexales bacterium]
MKRVLFSLPVMIIALFISIDVYAGFFKNKPQSQSFSHTSSQRQKREDALNLVIEKILTIFQPYVSQEKNLKVRLYWDDNDVNAAPWRTNREWGVSIYGGLLNHSLLTVDSLTVVMCHVLGHHFAGYPYKDDKTWMSVEGRSDYFATQSCVKKVWEDDHKKNQTLWYDTSAEIQDFCTKNSTSNEKNTLCARGLTAVENLMKVMSPSRDFHPDQQDSSHAPKTLTQHPAGQCRYTTFVQGLLCDKNIQLDKIPGSQEGKNRNSKEVEATASSVSCVSENKTLRWPRCWFQPKVKVEQTNFLTHKNESQQMLYPGDEIRLYGNLLNTSNHTFRSSRAVIYNFHSPWIYFDKKSTVSSQILRPNESVITDEPYIGVISPRAPCGIELSIPIMVEYGDFSEMSFVPLKIGEEVSAFKHKITTNGDILDHLSLETEIDSREIAYGIEKVKIIMDLNHTAFDDLEITLTDPAGVEHIIEGTLHDMNNSSRHAVNGEVEYDVEFVKGIKNGLWSLKIEDRIMKDEGFLRSWSIEAFKSVCGTSKKH